MQYNYPVILDDFIQLYLFLRKSNFNCLKGCTGVLRDCLAECQDNMTECDIMSWCHQPDFPEGQHYKIIIETHCNKSVPVLI